MPQIPNIDRLSFWFGFLAATLFWWVVIRLRPTIPVLREIIKKTIRDIRERNLEGADGYLRKETLRRAQRQHLASALFSLDDILIEPRLIAPPIEVDPDKPLQIESILDQIIPYLPEWPELASAFGANTLTPAQALQGGSNVALIGQPGSGKTVCLAFLASQIARRETAAGPFIDFAPIYLHVLDLDLTLLASNDPVDNLIKALSSHAPVLMQNQLKRLILDRFREAKVIMILDGLDEIHPASLLSVVNFLKSILEKYPRTRLIVSASPDYIDGLNTLQFTPLSLAVWGMRQRNEYLDRWSKAWTTSIAPELTRQTSIQTISPLLLNNWLINERAYWSPLEWTLKIWSSYVGDLLSPTQAGVIESFIARSVNHVVTHASAEILAREFAMSGQAALKYSDLVKTLNSHNVSSNDEAAPLPEAASAPQVRRAADKGGRDMILSVGEQIMETLIQGGILAERSGQMISFNSPVFAGFLASFSISTSDRSFLSQQPYWPIANQTLKYNAAFGTDTSWVDPFVHSDSTILHRNLLMAARWLSVAPANVPWRSPIFRQMIDLFQTSILPFGLRARLSAAFACSNDTSIGKLFLQLIASPSPDQRQLVLLGIGAWGDPAMVNDILGLMNDPSELVRYTACLALTSIQTEPSLRAVAEALRHGDEGLRQAAAESLAQIADGANKIREATTADDILTRRASVFGLLQIHQPWTKDLLEKIAVEDGQWVVRNIAAQALEVIQSPDPHIPKPPYQTWDSPWLLSFAAKRGMGMTPGIPPYELLLLALNSGVLDSQVNALTFVKELPEERFFAPVYMLYSANSPELREAALYTLWYWAIGGIKLPPPSKFGLTLI